MRKICLVTVLLATGCVSQGEYIPTQPEIMNSLAPFMGMPVEQVVAAFGMPQEQTELMGKKVFIWYSTREWGTTLPQTVTSTTSGVVGSLPYAQIPYTSSTTYQYEQSVSQQISCTMEIYLDEAGVVINFGIRGKAAACKAFYLYGDSRVQVGG